MDIVLYVAIGIYVVMSIVAYGMYRRDKRIAERNARRLKSIDRVSERTLHTLELLGGWPGALVAQRSLRHKNQKRPYQIVFRIIVAVHIIGWALGLGAVFVF